jgi:hypothetical protein
MKTLGLLLSATVVVAVSLAGTEPDAGKEADGAPAPLSTLLKGDEMLDRLPPVLFGRPLGDNGVVVRPGPTGRAPVFRYHGGRDYKLRILRPGRDVDYKIVKIQPDPNVDYKIRNFCPKGLRAYSVPRSDGRRGIIIAPKPGGRAK